MSRGLEGIKKEGRAGWMGTKSIFPVDIEGTWRRGDPDSSGKQWWRKCPLQAWGWQCAQVAHCSCVSRVVYWSEESTIIVFFESNSITWIYGRNIFNFKKTKRLFCIRWIKAEIPSTRQAIFAINVPVLATIPLFLTLPLVWPSYGSKLLGLELLYEPQIRPIPFRTDFLSPSILITPQNPVINCIQN